LHRYAPQVVAVRPEVARAFADQGREGCRVGDLGQQGFVSERRADHVDGEPECGSQFVVVGGPLAAASHAGHPETVPAAYALGCLSFVQLLVVSAVVAAAKIAFSAASGAYLRELVRPADLLVANARFESTTWSSTAIGPPLGGAAIGLFGPVTTVVADAVSYLLSTLGLTAIEGKEERPQRTGGRQAGPSELLNGWRHILGHGGLRPLYLNNLLVGGLIMATEPLLAVLLLRQLRFPAWQYGLAFAVPCAGGLIGSRLARRVVARYGRHRVFRAVGTLRSIWLIGLAFVRPDLTSTRMALAVAGLVVLTSPLLLPRRLGRRQPGHRPGYLRSGLKPARTSSEKSCGCSQAAKCPPLSTSLK
jgi:hypothetical protein